MKAPRNRALRALASSITLVAALAAPRIVVAQDDADAADKPEGTGDTASEAPAAAEADAGDKDPGDKDAEDKDSGDKEASAEGSLGAEASLGADTEAKAAGEATAKPSPEPDPANADDAGAEPAGDPAYGIGVMRLPDSAYPEPRPRGIKGGSLWFTFHGLQWPYMPMLGESPGVMLGVSGFGWVDPSYAVNKSTEANQVDETQWRTQGRFGLRLTPTYSRDDWFVQAQAELIANSDQASTRTTDPDTDDLWVRVGQWNKWDIQAGRYEAWEIYHFGMGLDQATFERDGATGGPEAPPSIYGVTYGYYRSSVGNIAGHIYLTDFLRVELLGKFGSATLNTVGGRPAAVLDLGIIKFKVGAEYIKERSFQDDNPRENELRGAGASLQLVLDPYLEAGINGAYGLTDSIDNQGVLDQEGTFTTYSYGGFANARVIENLLVGVGGNYTWKENVQRDMLGRVGEFDHFQSFAAIQYALFGQLYVKLVGAYAQARMAPTFTQAPPYDNTSYSARLRLSFYF